MNNATILRLSRTAAVCAALFLSSCAPTGVTLDDFDTTLKAYKIDRLPTQADYPEDDAVLIIDQTDNQIMMGRTTLYTLETHHIVKKLLRNIDEQSTVNIFVGEDEEMVDIKARTIRPDGSIVDLKPSDFYTLSGIGESSILFANIKTVRFTFPAADKECVIEYIYQKEKDQPFVNDVWNIQNDVPTMHNQYSITMPLGLSSVLPYRYKSYPESIDMKPQMFMNNSRYSAYFTDPITFIWARGSVPAFKAEEMMPPKETYRAHTSFALSAWDGWSGIAAWYNKEFFKPQLILTDSISRFALQLTEGCVSDSEKIKSVYNYTRRLRYVAVQLGLSGLRPSAPEEVLGQHYGDCKNKSILCIALLKSLGIDAHPVLVETATTGRFDEFFPSWNFNHMIVKAADRNGKVYWMDPTSEYSRFTTLPWEVQNIPVLTINTDTTGVVETTPGSAEGNNSSRIDSYVEISEDGRGSFRTKLTIDGEEARYYRNVVSEKSYTQLKEIFKKMIMNEAVQASIDTVVVEHFDDLDSSLVVTMTYVIPNALQRQGDIALFSVHVFKVVNDLRWTAKESRKYPIWFPFSQSMSKISVVRFNDTSMSVNHLPGSVELSNRNMQYTLSFAENNPRTVVINEKMKMKTSEIAPEYYQSVKNFYEKVKLNSEKTIVLEKKKAKK
ncbi:MAG: DUF3857 domain-containing protein [Bacteroidota bacterium]